YQPKLRPLLHRDRHRFEDDIHPLVPLEPPEIDECRRVEALPAWHRTVVTGIHPRMHHRYTAPSHTTIDQVVPGRFADGVEPRFPIAGWDQLFRHPDHRCHGPGDFLERG